jgi:glyoxylase-like metal-dependent hydrolase (beta-lactamase superfamily II)
MSDLDFKTQMEFEYAVPRTLAPGVRRIVANNPSVFTFKGTNTYIVGNGPDLALIDPGPEDDAHFNAIMTALGDAKISHILITHTHRDHIDGLPRLAAATGATVCAHGRTARDPGETRISPSGGEFSDATFTPDHTLADGDTVSGSDWSLTAVHTPGHAPDHLCFQLDGTGLFFSGDHVMGWNTSVVAPPEGNMGDYLASLEKLLEREDKIYFPGHGGQIPEPRRFAKAYLVHRRVREQAILAAIRNGSTSIEEVVAQVYKGLDQRLVRAASFSVQAHIEHMAERGIVTAASPLTFTSRIGLS